MIIKVNKCCRHKSCGGTLQKSMHLNVISSALTDYCDSISCDSSNMLIFTQYDTYTSKIGAY